jgi:hypothetical protein
MKLEPQNYAVIVPTVKSYIKFNNNKINSLQRSGFAQNYRILHKLVQRLSKHKLTSKFRTTVILKIPAKENNDS